AVGDGELVVLAGAVVGDAQAVARLRAVAPHALTGDGRRGVVLGAVHLLSRGSRAAVRGARERAPARAAPARRAGPCEAGVDRPGGGGRGDGAPAAGRWRRPPPSRPRAPGARPSARARTAPRSGSSGRTSARWRPTRQ